MQMIGSLGAKRNFIFSALHLLSKKKDVLAPLTVRYYRNATVFHFLCPISGYYPYTTAGCERKNKKFYVIKFCTPNFFDSFFAPLSMTSF